MTKARLLSTVAATLLLSAGIASAQDMKKEGAAPAPAAQQSAPAEKVAPTMKAGEKNADTHKAPDTVGQAPKASDADKTHAADKAGMDKGAMDKNAGSKSDADVKSKSAAETKTPDNKAGATKSSETAPSKDNAAQKSSDSKASDSKASPSATTGQGAAAGSAKLSTEQRTKITTVIRSQKVERVDAAKLNISISVGARIPERGVHFYPLPQEVFVIYPEWRGYDYILVGDQILVIDPRSHEIVAILEA